MLLVCTYKERRRVSRLSEEGIAPVSVLLDRSLKTSQTSSIKYLKHHKLSENDQNMKRIIKKATQCFGILQYSKKREVAHIRWDPSLKIISPQIPEAMFTPIHQQRSWLNRFKN